MGEIYQNELAMVELRRHETDRAPRVAGARLDREAIHVTIVP